MRKIPVGDLREGMVVGRPVLSADGLVLLNTGKRLRNSYIANLKAQGIPAVYIEDGLMPDDVVLEDVISDQTRLRANKVVKDMLTGLEMQMAGSRPPSIDEDKLKRTVNEILGDLLKNGNVMVDLADIRALDDYTFGHSVNVCVLALLTAISLGYGQAALFQLGMGAILHDVGKVKVPAHILNKPGGLTPSEFEIIKKHSYHGYEIMQSQRDLHHLSAQVAYQHHEKYDGSGYPRGLKGDEIHEYARIVGMVDVYDALTADRVYRKAYQPFEAFEMIAGSGNYLFDYRHVQAFLSNVALYPAGTTVQLSNGLIGVVTGTPKGMSHRPNVRALFDRKLIPLAKPEEYQLSLDHKLLITRILSEEEYQLAVARYNQHKGKD